MFSCYWFYPFLNISHVSKLLALSAHSSLTADVQSAHPPDSGACFKIYISMQFNLYEPCPKTEKGRALCRNGTQTDKCNLEGMEWRSFANAEYQKDKRSASKFSYIKNGNASVVFSRFYPHWQFNMRKSGLAVLFVIWYDMSQTENIKRNLTSEKWRRKKQFHKCWTMNPVDALITWFNSGTVSLPASAVEVSTFE